MVVLKTYYEIIDRPSIEVNKCWKVCHILLYIFAALSGLFTYIIFNNLESLFEDNCILFPTIVFATVVVNTDTGEHISVKRAEELLYDVGGNATNTTTKVVIDKSKTIWGGDDLCNYYEYIPIVSFLVGLIFVTFYCMCPRGGSRRAQAGIRAPWNIVPLTLLMTGVFTIIIFNGYFGVQNGIQAFCNEFKDELNTTKCSRGIGNYSLIGENYYGQAYNNILILRAIYFSCVLSWLIAFIILIVRSCCCVIDFKIMKLTLSTLTRDDESSNEEDNTTTTTQLKTGSLNEIDTETLVTETQELLTQPVNRRKSLSHV